MDQSRQCPQTPGLPALARQGFEHHVPVLMDKSQEAGAIPTHDCGRHEWGELQGGEFSVPDQQGCRTVDDPHALGLGQHGDVPVKGLQMPRLRPPHPTACAAGGLHEGNTAVLGGTQTRQGIRQKKVIWMELKASEARQVKRTDELRADIKELRADNKALGEKINRLVEIFATVKPA